MKNTKITISKKGDDGRRIISVRISDNILQKIDELSKISNRSRNELINIILESAIDNVEIE